MGKRTGGIDDELGDWLRAQPVFFVASAPLARSGHVNCSPKGNRGEFAVLDEWTVAYLDQTGSGAETIAHVRENGRLTLMFCAFSGPCRIVRLYGLAETLVRADARFDEHLRPFAAPRGAGSRAIITVRLDRVADSCGYGVPLLDFVGHRRALDAWSEKKGEEGIVGYQRQHNSSSIDGLPALEDDELATGESPVQRR